MEITDLSKVPVFILAGGLGTRLSEETHLKPKPMIEIGDIPIITHIMRWYYSFGFNDFIICAGYRSWEVKEYFLNYKYRQNHLIIDHRTSPITPPESAGSDLGHEKWKVSIFDTGMNAMTGARIAKALKHLQKESFENFAVTYGDGLCDVNLKSEFQFHINHNKIGTVLGVPPVSRFGEIDISENGLVNQFIEKPNTKMGLINGGFFFFKRDFEKYLDSDDSCILERKPLERLVYDKQLSMYEHRGFWQCMDTLRDKNYLQEKWDKGNAPWFPKISNKE